MIECGVLDGDLGQQHAMIAIRGEELWSGVVVMARREGPHVYLVLRYQSVPEVFEDDSPESVTVVVIAEQSNKRRCHQGWAFYCPREIGEKRCNRVVTTLYLPPGTMVFGCRHCYALKYSSTCRSDKRISAYYNDLNLLGKDLEQATIDLRMGGGDPLRHRLVIAAFAGLKNANLDLKFIEEE